MAIYYLDVDDEITSAATRIRDTSDTRVALVLTAGSHVATSRINFMLLAREARKRGKRLAIVSSDPSTQSVARSAELPVFDTVGDYERAEARMAAAEAAAEAGVGGAGAATGRTRAETATALDELAITVAGGAKRDRAGQGSPSRTLASKSERSRVPWPAVAGGLFLVALLVGGGLFFIYPSAKIDLTLAQQPIGPLALSVTVDPRATAVDDTRATIPGVDKAFPVQASGSYAATGEQIDETAASGTVRFSSINTLFAVPVLAGTTVSTASGVSFTTTQSVNVPAATVSGSTITRGTAIAPIMAVKQGTAGNVAANAITKLPSDLASAGVSVTNPEATAGGTHTVTTVVTQTDIDAAAHDLLGRLDDAFKREMQAPASHPTGSDLFPDTAKMSVAVCNPDPSGLVGEAAQSFQLVCTATGTATVATLSDVTSLAERRIESLVGDGYLLVEGSVETTLGEPTTTNGTVVVPVTARASEVKDVTVDEVRAAVAGKSLDAARTYLSGLGTASISMSPSWANTMPSFDFRIDVEIVAPASGPSPAASGSPAGTGSPTALPPATPRVTAPTVASPTPAETPSPSETPAETPTPTPAPSESPTDTPTPTPTPSPNPTSSPSSSS